MIGKKYLHLLLQSRRKLLGTRNKTNSCLKTTSSANDSSKSKTQAIHDQTKAIPDSSQNLNKNLQKSIEKGIQGYDALTTRNIQIVTDLVNSNLGDSSNITSVSNLLNDKNKSQFNLEPVEGS